MIFDLQRFNTTENNNSITIICGAPGELTYESGVSSSANLTFADIQIRKLAHRVDGLKKDTPTLTLSEFTFNKFIGTATITYDGDGQLSTTVGTISGNTLTISANLYEKITGTLSASETKDYYATSIEFEAKYYGEDYLISYLPFDKSVTEDLCGGTWTAYNSPSIGAAPTPDGKALMLNNNQYLKRDSKITFGGQNFTICGLWYIGSSTSSLGRLFEILANDSSGKNGGLLLHYKTSTRLDYSSDGKFNLAINYVGVNNLIHIAIVYQYSTKTAKIYINGVCKLVDTFTYNRVARSLTFNYNSFNDGQLKNSYMDEFQIYDGVALWTEDFTPPTAEDYAALRAAWNKTHSS